MKITSQMKRPIQTDYELNGLRSTDYDATFTLELILENNMSRDFQVVVSGRQWKVLVAWLDRLGGCSGVGGWETIFSSGCDSCRKSGVIKSLVGRLSPWGCA